MALRGVLAGGVDMPRGLGCCAFAACSMFFGSLISLLDELPVLIDHCIEVLVCSNGCPARIGSIIGLVLGCFGKYVSSLFFARPGLVNLGRGGRRSRGCLIQVCLAR